MQKSSTLWLARHAQPLVEPGVCYGQLDMPADAAATQRAARMLADALPCAVPIACSPLKRCVQLAEALQALRPDLPPALADIRLMEMNFGAWESRPWQAIGEKAMQAWTDDFANHRVGTSGESVALFMQRVADALDEAALGAKPDLLWITHAGVMRSVDVLLRGNTRQALLRAADWPRDAPGFGQCKTVLLPSLPKSLPHPLSCMA